MRSTDVINGNINALNIFFGIFGYKIEELK